MSAATSTLCTACSNRARVSSSCVISSMLGMTPRGGRYVTGRPHRPSRSYGAGRPRACLRRSHVRNGRLSASARFEEARSQPARSIAASPVGVGRARDVGAVVRKKPAVRRGDCVPCRQEGGIFATTNREISLQSEREAPTPRLRPDTELVGSHAGQRERGASGDPAIGEGAAEVYAVKAAVG